MSVSWPRLFDMVSSQAMIKNDPLLGLGKKILELCPPPAKLLEVGVGSGVLAGYLQDFGYKVVGIDKDPAVIAYAKKRLRGEMLGIPLLLERDAFQLYEGLAEYAPFSLAWSQGLLEHFKDEEIMELLRQQLTVAETVVFSVPSENYPRKEYGDERGLPLPHWFGLCQSLGELAEPTLAYYGHDLHILAVLRRKGDQNVVRT